LATSLRGSASIPSNFGAWPWTRAPQLQLDAATVAEAQAAVKYIHTAISQRRADDVVRVSGVWLDTISRAYPARTLQQQVEEFKFDMFSEAGSKDWQVAPLVEKEFDFRLVAGGRLIQCFDVHWQPIVRTYLGQAVDMSFKMFLGRYNGVLQRLL
jgi:hypothetical protein